MATLTAKSSTIFIATGDETRVYRSVTDIPLELRQRLAASTRGMNSATILIADKRGREELVRALQGRPSEVHCRLVENLRAHQPRESAKEERTALRAPWLRHWLELLLPVAVGASLWLLIESHF
ncbi:MAG: hypothetical protein JOY54_03575 [Acidobacteriaceae bacterium]|nr:hypothetical protein [Acidobacteriaceae bacterium]